MKTIDDLTREYVGGEPPCPIHQLSDEMTAVSYMTDLAAILGLERKDVFELSACAGAGVVACWNINYKLCRTGGIPTAKLYQDGAIMAMLSEEGQVIKAWAESHLPSALSEVAKCRTKEERQQLYKIYCAAAYRYGMALEMIQLQINE